MLAGVASCAVIFPAAPLLGMSLSLNHGTLRLPGHERKELFYNIFTARRNSPCRFLILLRHSFCLTGLCAKRPQQGQRGN